MKPTHNWQTVWRTKDGRTIPIKEMTDSHLTNTIRFLERAHQRYVDDMTKNGPPVFQGEMAQMYADEEYALLADSTPDDLFAIFMWLKIEASEREERRICERHDSHDKVTP